MAKKYQHKLPDEIFDESVKLLKCQRERMQSMQERGASYASLARQYNISKSAAYYVCNPGAAEKKNEKWLKVAKRYYKKEKAVASAIKSRNKAKCIEHIFKLAS